MSENRHAYLIVAHHQLKLLINLCVLLDDEHNDIYIHADSRWDEFDENKIQRKVSKSHMFFIKREKVYWGDFSQIHVTLQLLKEANKKPYSYYHLLSGVDMPIKNANYIYNYFEQHNKIEYIQFESSKFNEEKYFDRYMYRHYFRSGRRNKVFKSISVFLYLIQKKLKFRKKKYFDKFYKGSNWFSITNSFVNYVLKNEKIIIKQFKHSLCGDEIFLQTLIMESPYKKRLVKTAFNNEPSSNLREVDWRRGNPYVWTIKDKEKIKNSKCMFARKFDTEIDDEIINYVLNECRDE